MNSFAFKPFLLNTLIFINAAIFFSIAIVHFYWAFGGTLWYGDVLPTNTAGTKRLNPSAAWSFAVAVGLLLLALLTFGTQGVFDRYLTRQIFRYGTLVIAFIFLLRAIGDFKFVGFFKTITTTKFAYNDTWYFSPLCLFLAISSLLVFILSNKQK